MTYADLLDFLKAYALVLPSANDQQVYDVKVSTDGSIKIVLEHTTISIPIT